MNVNTIAKVAASAVAAASVGVGVYVATIDDVPPAETGSTEINWSLYLPDIDNYFPELPVVAVPAVELPVAALPDLSFPIAEVPGVETPAADLPEVDMPGADMPALDAPRFVTLGTAAPVVIAPAVVAPGADAPVVTAPSADTPKANAPRIAAREYLGEQPDTAPLEISAPEVERITLTLPETGAGEISAGVFAAARKMAVMQELFRDKRSAAHDRSFASGEVIDRWTQIYREYAAKSCVKVALPDAQIRMISEVLLPKNAGQFAVLRENLAYYKGRGYTSVLVTFDGSERVSDLRSLVKYLRYLGWEVWFAFSGPESLAASVFVEPALLREQLMALAQYSTGMILGWRRTSAHLLLQDDAWMNYLCASAREGNPALVILGEVYYGNTAEHPHAGQWGWGINLPEYASGAILCNFGFSGVDAESICGRLVPAQVGNVPQIAVVTGQKPYYLTEAPNGLSQEVNQEIKERIEVKFVAAGCRGSVTLQDDGKHLSSNNLSETPYSSLATERTKK